MHSMPERFEDDVDELLRERLGSPPRSWVARAEEIPQLAKAAATLDERAVEPTDDAMRSALEHVGLKPDDERLRALARLRDLRSRR
jgi:hypothetical protein